MTNSNTPAVAQNTLPAELPPEVAASNWGAIEELETTDLLVPKIFHQQGLSQFVKDGKAKAGDFCDSITGEILVKREEKLELIIFGVYKSMIISKLDPQKMKFFYEKTIIITPENAKEMAAKPFIEEIGNDQYKNNLTYNYYCLIPNLMKELPYVISLGSTKAKVAKKVNAMLYKLSTLKRPGASVVFEFKSVEDSNDDGDWYNLEVSQGRNSTAEEMIRAHAWYLKSKSQTFKVVEEEGAAAFSADDNGDDIPL